jgi:predicted DNA-binding helix-hairpin-helix protein
MELKQKNSILHKFNDNKILTQVMSVNSIVTLKNILLRIPGLAVQVVDKILAHIKFPKIRLTDLSRLHLQFDMIRPFVVTADCIPSITQLDSLHFAKTKRPEAHARLDFFGAYL